MTVKARVAKNNGLFQPVITNSKQNKEFNQIFITRYKQMLQGGQKKGN